MSRWRQGAARLWYVHPPIVVRVRASATQCLLTLTRASRPNIQRLHLRNLFSEGRRYYLQPLAGGFRLTCNSSLPWNRRSRTSLAAVVYGTFSESEDGMTQVDVQARWRALYLLDVFLIPSFIASILVFTPWPQWLITALAVGLYGLSWVWHRLTAVLQAADMIYFVQRALEDLPTADVSLLPATVSDVVTPEADFYAAWEQFYRQHKDENAPESPGN